MCQFPLLQCHCRQEKQASLLQPILVYRASAHRVLLQYQAVGIRCNSPLQGPATRPARQQPGPDWAVPPVEKQHKGPAEWV